MRLIKVVFIDEALINVSVECLICSCRGAKQHAFFIDVNTPIKLLDVIINDAYTDPMIVVDILSNTPEIAGELCELKKEGINVKYMSLKYIKLMPITRRELFEGTNQIIKEEDN